MKRMQEDYPTSGKICSRCRVVFLRSFISALFLYILNRRSDGDMTQCVREVEHGRFTPLVFHTLGDMGPTAQVVYKRLTFLIATKTDQPYSAVIRLIWCQLKFSLLHSTITCLRGSRRSKSNLANIEDVDPNLILMEGWVPYWLY